MVGATSSGEFIDGVQSEAGVAMILLDIDREYYTVSIRSTRNADISHLSKESILLAKSKFSRPAFGSIVVNSNMDEGSKFAIHLPI